jgi:hypothetical protein
MEPGLRGEAAWFPDRERKVEGARRAHTDDLPMINRIGAASRKRGILETVQYRRNPTFLERGQGCNQITKSAEQKVDGLPIVALDPIIYTR